MLSLLRTTHRFLNDHQFYPLVLSSLLAFCLFLLRAMMSRSLLIYSNLVWNLFLAWMPYLFSLLAVLLERNQPRRWWNLLVPGILWLLFFPNAPYLLTDFFHFQQRAFVPLWFDLGLISTFALTGILLAIVSLRSIHLLIESYMGKFLGWFFILFSLGLSGLGLYLGRFSRWNSWDMLIDPHTIISEVVDLLSNPRSNLGFYGFTFIFTSLLLVCYLTFISIQRSNTIRQST